MTESAAAGVARTREVVSDVLVQHAHRGLRLRVRLRLAVIAFLWATLLLVPPDEQRGWCWAVALAYPVLWLALGYLLGRRRGRDLDIAWVPLLLDIVVLGVLTLLTGVSDNTWTAYLVVNGFFLLPILAATQLRPVVGLALSVPIVGVYAFSSIITRDSNDEPWQSVGLRIALLVGVCLGSVALSRIQRSRVDEIGRLALDRSGLLTELTEVEQRERQQLSEALHDGALQYVLAARMDLEDVRDGDGEAVERVDHALTTSAGLLRRTVSELHPAVLDSAGLVRAVEDLAHGLRERGIAVRVQADGLPVRPATDAERTVFSAVRELVGNVVKHARATQVEIDLHEENGALVASVADDGEGFDDAVAARRLADGHIGLASQRLRLEAAGGGLAVTPLDPGVRLTVRVPTTRAPRRVVVEG